MYVCMQAVHAGLPQAGEEAGLAVHGRRALLPQGCEVCAEADLAASVGQDPQLQAYYYNYY